MRSNSIWSLRYTFRIMVRNQRMKVSKVTCVCTYVAGYQYQLLNRTTIVSIFSPSEKGFLNICENAQLIVMKLHSIFKISFIISIRNRF